ncbi:MAG: hypothetical protein WCQ00_02865 [bacterium]
MKKILSTLAIALLVSSFSLANAESQSRGENSQKELNENSNKNEQFESTSTEREMEKNKIENNQSELYRQTNGSSSATSAVQIKEQNKMEIRSVEKNNGNNTKQFSDGRRSEKSSTTASSTNKEDSNGKSVSEDHRSTVATFVKSLLSVADREGGIGSKVREIARNQNDSATTTASSIEKVEKKGSISKFFFGSDYRNLNVIKDEMATTTANIAQLKLLLDKAATNTDRTALDAQIKVLEGEQTKLTNYVTQNENAFSLFGWLTKMFVK